MVRPALGTGEVHSDGRGLIWAIPPPPPGGTHGEYEDSAPVNPPVTGPVHADCKGSGGSGSMITERPIHIEVNIPWLFPSSLREEEKDDVQDQGIQLSKSDPAHAFEARVNADYAADLLMSCLSLRSQ